jgi:hypothetical protein
MIPSLPLGVSISPLWRLGSVSGFVFVLAFFDRVGMFGLLPYVHLGCKANGYVLVLSRYLQPQQQRMAARARRTAAKPE